MEPIHCRGNAFWHRNHRFLIKGVSYIPRKFDINEARYNHESLVDPLGDDYVELLNRDIAVFHELGLNTIQISGVDPTQSHDKAMKLLQSNGIYVLAEIGERMRMPDVRRIPGSAGPSFESARSYTLALLRRVLRIVDQLADHPNLLGFTVCGDRIHSSNLTKMAEVCRAAVREVKAFLQLRGGRLPPVGIHMPDVMMLKIRMMEYYSAGAADERVDYFAHECYSWAAKSNFQMSGWQNMVNTFSRFPVPMFLAEYGANVNGRLWDEIECLYSSDMTPVFSGGCMYTYFEHGNSYGIVEIDEQGQIERKEEFEKLKSNFGIVEQRSDSELLRSERSYYEAWNGTFPQANNSWHATSNIPNPPASMQQMLDEIRNEQPALAASDMSRLELEGNAKSP